MDGANPNHSAQPEKIAIFQSLTDYGLPFSTFQEIQRFSQSTEVEISHRIIQQTLNLAWFAFRPRKLQELHNLF